LQPDIVVVCDPKKIRMEGIVGAPDFIAEILSPSTMTRDFHVKKRLYERNKVKEYWIISTKDRVISQFKLLGDMYEGINVMEGRIESFAIEGFGFELEELFSALSIISEEGS